MSELPPVALTIAGSDNSAGAGAQADLKTFSALGVYGLTAITCVVAEVPGCVSAIHSVPEDIVREQIRLSLETFPVAALKTGLLRSAEIVAAVCDILEGEFAKRVSRPSLVVDPVMIATSGTPLLDANAMTLYTSRLFKLATLVTPNLDEARVLAGFPVTTIEEMHAAGKILVKKYGTAFLLKGGHLRGGDAVDALFTVDGKFREFSAPFVAGVATHGTGCTYSAAITAHLAKGMALEQAIAESKRFVTRAIAGHFTWKSGENENVTALNHFRQAPTG